MDSVHGRVLSKSTTRNNQARIPLDERKECGQMEPKRSSPCLAQATFDPSIMKKVSPIPIQIRDHKSDYQWLVELKLLLLGHHRSRTKGSRTSTLSCSIPRQKKGIVAFKLTSEYLIHNPTSKMKKKRGAFIAMRQLALRHPFCEVACLLQLVWLMGLSI